METRSLRQATFAFIAVLLVGTVAPRLLRLRPLPGPPSGLELRRVLEVTDGDTLVVEGIGSVRILGIDTPETMHPDMDGPQPFGQEASEALRELVEGKRVRLEPDVEPNDHYGRALRHVWVGRSLVAERLAEKGLAHSLILPPNLGHEVRIRDAVARARTRRRGLWSVARPSALPVFEAGAP